MFVNFYIQVYIFFRITSLGAGHHPNPPKSQTPFFITIHYTLQDQTNQQKSRNYRFKLYQSSIRLSNERDPSTPTQDNKDLRLDDASSLARRVVRLNLYQNH